MKCALVVALAGSAAAAPSFGDFIDALFGGSDDNAPRPSDFPNFPPMGTGSGIPFPFPTAGAPFPTGSSIIFPMPGSDSKVKREVKALHIDYQLAPTAVAAVKNRDLEYRQLGGSALPPFSLLDPNDTPPATVTATGLPTAFPTELPGLPTDTAIPELPTAIPTDLPSGFPTPPAGGPTAPLPIPTGEPSFPFPSNAAPFPTGEAPFPTAIPFPTAPPGTGFPGLPTTFATFTRGPTPTVAPEAPAGEGEEVQNGNGWLDWLSELLTGKHD